MRLSTDSSRRLAAFRTGATALFVLGVGAAFWWPARIAAGGYFPAPLDDVYIHFDFARSLAEGHPFEWVPGNGYSSGETSPLYAVLLAIGWTLGFHGRLLGVWAAVLAVAGVTVMLRSIAELAGSRNVLVGVATAVLLLSVGTVDWTLFSGMEIAAFGGALGRTLLALERTRAPLGRRGGLTLEASQLRLGLWCAILVFLRPESITLAGVFAIVAARGVGRRSAVLALLRVTAPAALATAAVLGANALATGTFQSAGAQLKLLSSNPYLSSSDRARAYVENLVTFAVKGVASEIDVVPVARLALPVLVASGLVLAPSRSRRSVAAACVLGALAWILLVSWNSNAPFHNYRYYAPAMLLVLVAASLGGNAVADVLGRRRGAVAALVLVGAALVSAAPRLPVQITHFTRATRNIREQQIEVALRLAALTRSGDDLGGGGPARVLLNDSGAIPFVSRLPALDALGLGGYRTMPFALAATYGEAATLELLERLEPHERPRYLAVYPHWFGGLAGRFGHELDRVTITDNLICAGPTKVIYRADWGALDVPRPPRADVIDELDVGDVMSERDHAYRVPLPEGHTTFEILADEHGASRFDGGRIIPEGTKESFVVRDAGEGRGRLVMRIDDGARAVRMTTKSGVVDLALDDVKPGHWRHASAPIDSLATGDVIELEAKDGALRDFHVWIVRP